VATISALVAALVALEGGAPRNTGSAPLLSLDDLAALRRLQLDGLVKKHSEALNLDSNLRDALRGESVVRASNRVIQRSMMRRIHDALNAGGINHLFFKGLALYDQLGADPDERDGSDIDILISPGDLRSSIAILRDNGFVPLSSQSFATQAELRFMLFRNKAHTLRGLNSEVDLHWRVATAPDLMPHAQVLLERRRWVGLPGQELPTLSPADALAATAVQFYTDFCTGPRRIIEFVRLASIVDPKDLDLFNTPTRQLLKDMAHFVGEEFSISLPGLRQFDSDRDDGSSYLRRCFEQWGLKSLAELPRPGNAIKRFMWVYRHLARYSSRSQLLVRLVARGATYYPAYSPTVRPLGVFRALAHQLGRLLRGQVDSVN
jgi:hypothetical protein